MDSRSLIRRIGSLWLTMVISALSGAVMVSESISAEDILMEPLIGKIAEVDLQGKTARLRTSWSRDVGGELWIGIIHDDALYDAIVVSAPSSAEQDLSIPLGESIPNGDLQIVCIPLGQPIEEYPSAKVVWDGGKSDHSSRPFAWGLYKDTAGTIHPWNTTIGGMMMWEGAPYIPIGGMINTTLSWGTRPSDEEIPSSNFLVSQFELLKKYGLKDIYFNGFFIKGNPKSLAEAVRLAEEHGMRYGLHLSSSQEPANRSKGFVMDGERFAEFAVKKGATDTEIEVGLQEEESLAEGRCLWAVFSVDGKERLLASGVAQGRISEKEMGKLRKRELTHAFQAEVKFKEPLPEAGRMVFRPEIRMYRNDPSGFLEHIDEYIASIKEAYSLLNLGPGMRLWIDPFNNELHVKNINVSTSAIFRKRFAETLQETYQTVNSLNQAWGAKEGSVPDFETAARLVPIRDTGDTLLWMDPETAKVYAFAAPVDQSLHDLTKFKGMVAEEMVSRVADALKKIADVPVVLKHNCWASQMFINPKKSGGQDGMGFESYCVGDSLAYHNSLVPLAQALASGRHQWMIETETSAAAFEGQKDYPGYKDRLQMLNSFDLMAMLGSKGIYTFGFAFDPSGDNLQTTTLLRDPRQLEWMATYAETIRAASDRLESYIPEVYGWYPANFHERQQVREELKPFEMDGHYIATSGQIRMAPDGRWIIPASRPEMELHGMLAAWDYLTDSKKQGLLEAKPEYPVWLLSKEPAENAATLPYKNYPLNSFTASGIGVIPPKDKWMTLGEFRKEVLGYEVFQTVDIDGQTLPDGSLMVWTCSASPEARLRLPSRVEITNLQGGVLTASTGEDQTQELVLKPGPHEKLTGNLPTYIAYYNKGYYWEESLQEEVAILKGVSVEQLLSMNAPAWQRWVPEGVVLSEIAGWQEAEDPVATTFNQPRVDGYDAYSGFAGIGINTHWDAPEGEKFSARYEVEASQPFTTVWIRRMSRPAMNLEILVDGKSVGEIAGDSELEDSMHLNPWNAGLGVNDIDVGWAKIALGSAGSAGKHVIEVIATPFFDDERKLDTALLGGQSEASVETDAEKEFAKLQGVQIDALMLTK